MSLPSRIPSKQSKAARRRSGFSLIEVIVAIGVLTVSALAMSSTLASSHALEKSNHTRRAAENAMRSIGEQIMAFSDGALDAPTGWTNVISAALSPGGSIGTTFNVRGLTLLPGAVAAGSIRLITDETITDAALGTRLGLPRDLNGDGLALDADVSATAVLLPIIVSVNWTDLTGVRTVTQGFYLLGY